LQRNRAAGWVSCSPKSNCKGAIHTNVFFRDHIHLRAASKTEIHFETAKYDETGSFETFLVAQIQNCASYNKWTKKEQLIYLRSSQEKYAGQVLWDYSSETTISQRFGEANQSDKYRFELKSRRRRLDETLRNPHFDIRKLAALAVPELDHSARETMACGSFIDALNDPHFALKVRERFPKDLDAALRVAL